MVLSKEELELLLESAYDKGFYDCKQTQDKNWAPCSKLYVAMVMRGLEE